MNATNLLNQILLDDSLNNQNPDPIVFGRGGLPLSASNTLRGGDTAIQEAISLARFAKKVTVIHRRDRLRATAILQKRAFANEKIAFAWNSVVASIEGLEPISAADFAALFEGAEGVEPEAETLDEIFEAYVIGNRGREVAPC